MCPSSPHRFRPFGSRRYCWIPGRRRDVPLPQCTLMPGQHNSREPSFPGPPPPDPCIPHVPSINTSQPPCCGGTAVFPPFHPKGLHNLPSRAIAVEASVPRANLNTNLTILIAATRDCGGSRLSASVYRLLARVTGHYRTLLAPSSV